MEEGDVVVTFLPQVKINFHVPPWAAEKQNEIASTTYSSIQNSEEGRKHQMSGHLCRSVAPSVSQQLRWKQ